MEHGQVAAGEMGLGRPRGEEEVDLIHREIFGEALAALGQVCGQKGIVQAERLALEKDEKTSEGGDAAGVAAV